MKKLLSEEMADTMSTHAAELEGMSSQPAPAEPASAKKPRSVWVVSCGDDVLAVFSSIHKVATFVDQRSGVELRIRQWELDK